MSVSIESYMGGMAKRHSGEYADLIKFVSDNLANISLKEKRSYYIKVSDGKGVFGVCHDTSGKLKPEELVMKAALAMNIRRSEIGMPKVVIEEDDEELDE